MTWNRPSKEPDALILSIASGKGGTGKTTIAVNLALSISEQNPVQFLDCDVEEPNAHFFLKTDFKKKEPVYLPIPEVNDDLCTYCGRCAEVCAFNAMAVLDKTVLVFPELCHGCGSCERFCPEKAIREVDIRIGEIDSGSAGGISFIRGILDIGQVLSAYLIHKLRKKADTTRTVIIDAPPGTSCPVIKAVSGSDFSILVTEPTPFGYNDFVLAAKTLSKMQIPFGAVINRADLGDDRIQQYCGANEIPVLMEIPFDKRIAVAYSNGDNIIDVLPEYKNRFVRLHKTITRLAGETGTQGRMEPR